ncbi:MAG: VOC family protein [Proteobacteria bacterium]|nr:VOC family protein [Pseudomonadota bacterium]
MAINIHNLHHVNIETSNLAETRTFYETLLGLEAKGRANFPTTGCWMYLGDDPILHILEIEDTGAPGARGGGNRLDHFGVMATGLDAARKFLDDGGYTYKEAGKVVNDRLLRLFVEDPNGVIVEIAFLMDETGKKEEAAPSKQWWVGAHFHD